ncbi:hypothetical protein MASR1M12_10540 [Erysipelotrichia bacterium]
MSYLNGVVLVTAIVTYLVRMLPIVFFRRELSSRRLKAFMYYIPYAVLGSMTFPAILESTRSTLSAGTGFLVAILLAYCVIAAFLQTVGAAAAVFIVEYLTL